jgi:hypothetical protein
MWGLPGLVTVSEQRMSPKADCRIVRRCGLGRRRSGVCKRQNTADACVRDDRTDQHCSVTHCADDSLHVIRTPFFVANASRCDALHFSPIPSRHLALAASNGVSIGTSWVAWCMGGTGRLSLPFLLFWGMSVASQRRTWLTRPHPSSPILTHPHPSSPSPSEVLFFFI